VIPRHLQIMLLLLIVAVGGATLYMLYLQKSETRRPTVATVAPIAAPSANTAAVTMMIAYDDDAALRPEEHRLALPPEPTERARELLRTLVARYQKDPSPHPLPEGADVRDVYLMPEGDSGQTIAVVDVNSIFAESHRSGVLVEDLTIASIVTTLHQNLPEIARVKIIVEGQERPTLAGHADLTVFYSPAAARQLAREAQ
jgi:hypothetical protein